MLGGGATVVKSNVSPQNGLCRVFALPDDKVNAKGFERILEQFAGRLGSRWADLYLASAPTSGTRRTAEHGKFCKLCRKGGKTPFWCRQFWSMKKRKLWNLLCGGCCGKNFNLFLPSPYSSRKKRSHWRCLAVDEKRLSFGTPKSKTIKSRCKKINANLSWIQKSLFFAGIFFAKMASKNSKYFCRFFSWNVVHKFNLSFSLDKPNIQ